MKYYIIITLLLLILFSCSKKKAINIENTDWIRFPSENEENFFPYEFSFLNDTVILTDENIFKHKIKYEIENDSINLFFNIKAKKISFQIHSDSVISLNNIKFYTSHYELSNRNCYELINYQTKNFFINSIDSLFSGNIHLIKDKEEPKVILNDEKHNINKIPRFLSSTGPTQYTQEINIFVGKGIELKDLLKTYKWIYISGAVNFKINLVTKNETYEKFYYVDDYIEINDSLIKAFHREINIPPAPRIKEKKKRKRKVIDINNQTDFEKLPIKNDSTKYLFRITKELELFKYLELIEKIKNRKNIKKEITDYNNG